MSQAAVDHYLSEHANFQPASTNWLKQQRQSAIKVFGQNGFPTTRHEAWKYTDLRPLLKRNFTIVDSTTDSVDKDRLNAVRFTGLDCQELVFINGHYSSALSQNPETAHGARICSLANAGKDTQKLTETYLNQFAQPDKHGFAALNTAFVTDGAFIHLPDNIELDKPVHLIFIANKQQASFISHPRNLIVLGNNAKATVIESYIGLDNAEYCTNTVTEIVCGEGATLEHYKVQEESSKGFHIGYLHAQCQHDSRLDSHSVSLGGALVRNDIDVKLAGSGAHVGLNGLYMANGQQHVDNHTRVDHSMPHTSSDESYRGVLADKAHAVFNGKVVVHKDAQKTDAQQSNANLLLSDDAEIDTKPELEIYADDVKCSHGATVGQLDDNMLFYLRSRAIDAHTARSLLTFAFADEVIKRIKFAPIRERLEYKVVGRLPDASLIREFIQ
jgi:Fe-S cluster assembly protein SufD